jgi:hypothetical protein
MQLFRRTQWRSDVTLASTILLVAMLLAGSRHACGWLKDVTMMQVTVGRELPFTLKSVGAVRPRSPRPRYRRCRSDNRSTKGLHRIWAG